MNDSILRDWILNDISSFPRALEFPTIEIETVVVENNKKVYFIEIHPVDLNVLYFNRANDLAYVRGYSLFLILNLKNLRNPFLPIR